jgi:hypothetical protein
MRCTSIVKQPPPVVGALTWLAVLGAAVFADPKKGMEPPRRRCSWAS